MQLLVSALVAAVLSGLPAAMAGTEERVVVRPPDTGAALENPGMGWVFHHFDNALHAYGAPLGPGYDGRDFPGLTVVYLRVPWSVIEPVEGQRNWAVLDTVAQRYIAVGKQIAFRLTTFEGSVYQGTPEWVRQAGAKWHKVSPYEVTCWEPDYEDPIYLEKLERFLAAAGARYDGSPHLAFVDVGTIGIWGEGHPIARRYGMAMLKRHVDLHRKCFPRSLLVGQDDWDRNLSEPGEPTPLEYIRSVGGTFRDDSILVYEDPQAYKTADLAQPFWPDRPVILEMAHLSHIRNNAVLSKSMGRYLEDVEAYHASYVSIHGDPRELLQHYPDVVRSINQRLGYRLNLVEASWPKQVVASGTLPLTATWRNVGVAPCLPGGHPAYSLFDKDGNLVACLVDDAFDVRRLPVGAPGQAEAVTETRAFPLPYDLPAGELEVRVSVGDADGTPRIALPLPGDDGRRRYRLGTLTIAGEFAVTVGTARVEGDRLLLPVTWDLRNVLPDGVLAYCDLDEEARTVLSVKSALTAPLTTVGKHRDRFEIRVPEELRGKRLALSVGLTHEMLMGFGDAKGYASLLPERGDARRRVPVGTLEVGRDGRLRFQRAR
jgi:hypothetical protein